VRRFSCGCPELPVEMDEYCREHWMYDCHTMGKPHVGEGECPACFLARVRSVSLSAEATPTRRTR
jgi:hypothetical protein